MATPYIEAAHVQANVGQPEVNNNAADDQIDSKINQRVAKAITGSGSFTKAEVQENHLVELTGTPGSPFTVDMHADITQIVLKVLNSTDDVATCRNSAGGGTGQPIIPVGHMQEFRYDGTNFLSVSPKGHIPLDLSSLREIVANDIDTSANHGGILTSNSTPSYARINGATDKGLVVIWVLGNVDEVQFPPIPIPPDMNLGNDVTLHVLARMDGATDTPTIDMQAWAGIGDTEMGGVTAALSSTLAELTVTLTASNLTGPPLGFLNINMVVGTHATDGLELFAAWIEYVR